MTDVNAMESYEALSSELREVVARLENGDLPLAEALALYERGAQLAAACQKLLDSAELRVRLVQSAE